MDRVDVFGIKGGICALQDSHFSNKGSNLAIHCSGNSSSWTLLQHIAKPPTPAAVDLTTSADQIVNTDAKMDAEKDKEVDGAEKDKKGEGDGEQEIPAAPVDSSLG